MAISTRMRYSTEVGRPALATSVGVIGLVAGTLATLEVAAVLASRAFAAKFLPLVHTLLPVTASIALIFMLLIAAIDISLGVGVLARKWWAMVGMIARSLVSVPVDYANFRAGNHAGALFGLAVNIFVVWALLRRETRAWFFNVRITLG